MGAVRRIIFSIFIANVIFLYLCVGALANEKESILDVSLTAAINLTGEWRFHKIEFVDESMFQPEYDDSEWAAVHAPASWPEQCIEWGIWDIPLVLYRRTISIPAEWEGKQVGISCWFSNQSVVYVNGIKVDPIGPLYARYSDVTQLLHYGKTNYIAVTALDEGKLVLIEGGPPRVGILEKRLVTKVLQKNITIPVNGERINAILFHPAGLTKLPGLILVATAHYGWGVTDPWLNFADELAREGYSSLIIASKSPGLDHILGSVDFLTALDFIDPEHIGIIGADMAAKLAIIAATRDQRIKTVISMSSPEVKLDEKVHLCPILLIASEYDPHAEIAARRISRDVTGLSELLIFKGKVHGITFLEKKWTAIRQKILDWLKANI